MRLPYQPCKIGLFRRHSVSQGLAMAPAGVTGKKPAHTSIAPIYRGWRQTPP